MIPQSLSANSVRKRLHLLAVVVASVLASAAMAQVPASATATTPPSADRPLRVIVFNSRTCARGCKKVDEHLDKLRPTFADQVEVSVRYIDASEQRASENLTLMLVYDEHYQAKAASTPVAFVGRRALVGDKAILTGLEPAVAEALSAGHATYQPSDEDIQAVLGSEDGSAASRLLKELSVPGVMLAGLIDGVNPCAFTTIVFLLSMLAYLGKGRREVLAVGAGYSIAIFVAYFLFGLGILAAIKAFSAQTGLARYVSYAIGILALALAAWSFIDFIGYVRTRNTDAITLRLPASLKKRIHAVIRKGLRARNLFIGSLGVGFAVAVLESICTGQIYLPAVTAIAASPEMRAYAIPYLLLYNVMFMVPLLALMGTCYAGVSSERLGQMLRNRLGLIKLGMALLFAFLGVLVLVTA